MSIVCTVSKTSALRVGVESILKKLQVQPVEGEDFSVRLADGRTTYKGVSTMLAAIGENYSHASLLGSCAAERAEILQWVSLCASSPETDEVEKLWIAESGRFVAGTTAPTAADILLYYTIGPKLVEGGHISPKFQSWLSAVEQSSQVDPIDRPKAAASATPETSQTKAWVKPSKEEIEARRLAKEAEKKAKAEAAAKEGGEAQKAPAPAPAPKKKHKDAATVLPTELDLRVGKILGVVKHESAERLFVEKIDVGEAEPRTIVSGLVGHYTAEELQDRLLVVVCNMKPKPLVGITSHGMVLCACTETETKLVDIPEGTSAGTRIQIGSEPVPAEYPGVPSVSRTASLLGALRSDDAGVVRWGDLALSVNGKELGAQLKGTIVK